MKMKNKLTLITAIAAALAMILRIIYLHLELRDARSQRDLAIENYERSREMYKECEKDLDTAMSLVYQWKRLYYKGK